MSLLKSFIIFGTGDFAQLIYYYVVNDQKRKVAAFTVERKYISEKTFMGLPLVPFEEIWELYNPSEYSMVIAFIGKRMLMERKRIYEKAEKMGYEMENIIHSSASISSDKIAGGNIIMERVIVAPFSQIGKGNIMWSNATVQHHNVIGDFNVLAPNVSPSGFVKIGNHCFIGNNCTIKNRMEIADFTLVGAGAYVQECTEEYEVIVPSRSRILKDKKSIDMM